MAQNFDLLYIFPLIFILSYIPLSSHSYYAISTSHSFLFLSSLFPQLSYLYDPVYFLSYFFILLISQQALYCFLVLFTYSTSLFLFCFLISISLLPIATLSLARLRQLYSFLFLNYFNIPITMVKIAEKFFSPLIIFVISFYLNLKFL